MSIDQTGLNMTSPGAVPRVALFDHGFRPFFLLAGLIASLSILAWLAMWYGLVVAEGPWVGSSWHGHEMIFGFAIAGAAGFLLTAVPNWTGAPPVRSALLAALVGLWLAGRIALALGATLPPPLVAAIDLAFLPALAFTLGRPLVLRAQATRSPRNLVFLLFFALLWTANLLTHLDALGATVDAASVGLRLGRDTLLVMIGLVGGRIIPAFTRNALRLRGEEAPIRTERVVEVFALGGLGALLIADLLFGEGMVAGIAALVAALAHARRLALWQPLRTRSQPILWILHLGYAWLVIGLALEALADLAGWVPHMAAMHAFTAGAIGTMLLAVMSRVALGHTGRPLVVASATVAAYLLVTLAAALRVAAPFAIAEYIPLVLASGIVWSLAYGIFTASYLPILIGPRADGRAG